MHIYNKISDYLHYLSKEHDLSICVKDFSGFIPVNPELSLALQDFIAHNHPYCIYLKENKDCYFKCASMIPKMLKKAIATKSTFFGYCHAGLGEYVIPIINDQNVIGAITVGSFKNKELNTEHLFTHLTNDYKTFDINKLETLYETIKQPEHQNIDLIIRSLEIIAQTLANSYKEFDMTNNKELLNTSNNNISEEDKITEQVIKYIKEHITEKITLENLAQELNYSISYISRIFNKKMEMNINTYINKTRVEISKNYLLSTDLSITEIANMVGFEDASYYSKVFTKLLSISPARFKRRFSK